MPPVPQTCTLSGSSYDSIALRIAWPSMKQRRPDGTGYCTTLTANGITGHGHAFGLPEQQRQRHREAVVDVHLVDDA